MRQMLFDFETIDVNKFITKEGIELIGKAHRVDGGRYKCLANVYGCLCLVEVTINDCD